MSFYYLMNAVLLFAGVVAFIVAGFAGTFSRRLQSCRYRLMLAPLGFVVLGSLGHSIAARLTDWFLRATHGSAPGAVAGLFESAVLLLAGAAGILAGIALGASLDRVPAGEQTYTIANYWNRLRAHDRPRAAAKDNVIAISEKRKPGTVRRVNAVSRDE